MYYFSPLTLSFFDSRLQVPTNDCVPITREVYSQLLSERAQGKLISADPNGNPVASAPPAPSVSLLLDSVKAELRNLRRPILDALTGIAGRAARAGNAEIANEADALAGVLLDITDDPDLNTAQTLEDMRAAGVTAYRRIAAGASAELAVVFKEITGG